MHSLLLWRDATATPETWRNSSSGKSIEQPKRAATVIVAISKLLEEPRSKNNKKTIYRTLHKFVKLKINDNNNNNSSQ